MLLLKLDLRYNKNKFYKIKQLSIFYLTMQNQAKLLK